MKSIRWTKMGVLVVAAATSCSNGGDPAPGAPKQGASSSALNEEETIAVEAEISEQWIVIHASKARMQEIARQTCVERGDSTDGVCFDVPGWIPQGSPRDPNFDPNLISTAATGTDCRIPLCYARNEVCAGYFFETLARSPAPTIVTLTQPVQAMNLGPEGNEYGTTPVTRLRLQPVEGESRSASLRAATEHYRQSSRIALQLATSQTAAPDRKCVGMLNDLAGVQNYPSLADNDEDPTKLTWVDVYYETVIDAANQHALTLGRAVDSTTAVATSNFRGKLLPRDEVNVRWNKRYNSQAGAGRLLSYGEVPSGATLAPSGNDCDSGSFGLAWSPSNIPTCPSITNNAGAVNAIKKARLLGVSPIVPQNSTFAAVIAAAHKEDLTRSGIIASPSAISDAEALSDLKISAVDAESAREYLCAEQRMFGKKLTAKAGTWAVPRYHGTSQPTKPMSQGVIAAHMLGTRDKEPAANLLDDAYSAGGGIRAADQMKLLAASLKSANVTVHPKIRGAMEALATQLESEVGNQRLELLVGVIESGATSPRSLKLMIHGAVPSSGDTYYAVQGLAALKCATEQSVDGAPCTIPQPVWNLTNQINLDARMTDLPSGTITISETLAREDGPGRGISFASDEAIYVVRVHSGVHAVIGGAVPKPSATEAPGLSGFSQQILTPVGGILAQKLAATTAAGTKDCAVPENPCLELGLKSTLVPPLESEINGQQTSESYENSWQHYLEFAKSAADEADRLGEEVLAAGLAMDQRMEGAEDALLELCGPNTNADNPCEIDDPIPYVAFGDKPVCLWVLDGTVCKQKDNGKVDCPFLLPDGETNCDNPVHTTIDAQAEAITVTDNLKFGATPSEWVLKPCKEFDDLRNGVVADAERENAIKTLANKWNSERVAGIAKGIRYYESYADNYRLEYDGRVVFETSRATRPSDGGPTTPPCAPPPVDSGSSFWSQAIQCVVPSDCQPGHALDGCLGHSGADLESNWSLDTEPEALRERWAWGFGHLRRSVATLGVVSGTLSGSMDIPRVANGAIGWDAGNEHTVGNANYMGWPCSQDINSSKEPNWTLHCKPYGVEELYASARCVNPLKDSVLQGLTLTDQYRTSFGRPVNWNGFLANRIPSPGDWTGSFGTEPPLGSDAPVAWSFPWACEPDMWGSGPWSGCSLMGGGLDPQFIYCAMPSPSAMMQDSNPSQWGTSAQAYWQGGSSSEAISSGWVGSSFPGTVSFADGKGWYDARQKMWQAPSDGLCAKDPADRETSAIWRAFCAKPGSPALSALKTDRSFMHFGALPEQSVFTPNYNPPYFTPTTIATWLLPSPSIDVAVNNQFLFDLGSGSILSGNQPFQYALDARNIVDALELACHVTNARTSTPPSCKALEPGYVPADLEEASSILSCTESRLRDIAGAFTVGPIPRAVVDAFRSQKPIASTAGYGGELLDAMVAQYEALSAFEGDMVKIGDAFQRMAMCSAVLDKIWKASKELQSATSDREVARGFAALAQATSSLAQASSTLGQYPPSYTGALTATGFIAAAGLELLAGTFDIMAMEHEKQAQKIQSEKEALLEMQQGIEAMRGARDAARDAILQLNRLTDASAKLSLVRAQASRASARSKMADFAGPNGTDPQFVNTVMRRTYNTKLHRYENALTRARKAAYIARRAIEVRFGNDMGQMTDDMTFVERPKAWANRVCEMKGINYADIRKVVDPDAAVKEVDWNTPPGTDDFADEYIGDYVRKLEDFVRSYPFDYPLKDGDDTAVISLGDDIFRTAQQCWVPSDNRLLYSTEFNKKSTVTGGDSSVGWFVSGCDAQLSDGSAWTGCVTAIVKDQVSDELPEGALIYRLRHEPCIAPQPPGGGTTGPDGPSCPTGTTTPRGYLAQEFEAAQTATHLANIRARTEVGTRHVGMRVVRVSDSQVIASRDDLDATAPWLPVGIVFPAEQGVRYRLEIWLPSSGVTMNPADVSTWPSLFISAAQVESTVLQGDGTPEPARAWQRTGIELLRRDAVCHDFAGGELRRLFKEGGSYICNDGIHSDCTAKDGNGVPQQRFYETTFALPLEDIESGAKIPSGQVAVGNFNFRHNLIAVNLIGSGVVDCSKVHGASCYLNGFAEYSLEQTGDLDIRNWQGSTLSVAMDTGWIEHGKALAAERTITNPPSGTDAQLLEPYMKGEFKGRPIHGLYKLRIWQRPELQWDKVQDIQLIWKYHYWTRFKN